MLAGFAEPTSGGVLISGEDMSRVPPARRPTTTVFPHMSVARNIAFGRRRVHELSRVIVVDPEVLLLDEPLGALDLDLRRQEELLHLQRHPGTTFVHVTHDLDEAIKMADTIVMLSQGRVEDQGLPDRIYLKPATRFVATFMGDSNLVEGTVTQRRADGVIIWTAVGMLELPSASKER